MVTPKQIADAEHTLNQLIHTFQALNMLPDVLATLKEGVLTHADLEAEIAKAQANLTEVNKVLEQARKDLATTRMEHKEAEAALDRVRLVIKGLRI